MVFLRDDGSVFNAPLDIVWQFVGSGDRHADAHRHQSTVRKRLPGNSGEYSWEQPFLGSASRFTMRWTSFHPTGIAYEVLEGPFTGSVFFIYYTPRGKRTGVTVVGEFVSPNLGVEEIPAAVDKFFSTEFDQDSAGIEAWVRDSSSTGKA